ncbi:hypothetical protein OFB61_23545, partial [Escherichia coli]|nr:hypothetical protein [Escherichia coli]
HLNEDVGKAKYRQDAQHQINSSITFKVTPSACSMWHRSFSLLQPLSQPPILFINFARYKKRHP